MEKKMFRYYQTDEKGKWLSVTDSDDVVNVVLEKSAKKLTILALGELVDDETTDKLDIAYRGPLYFDIDCKNDLPTAITSANRLVDLLVAKGVNESDIQVFCSGSKGFHILVPQKVFSNGRPQKRLPWIYREMALTLFVTGMDFQVYSTGRGNSFRIPNVKRSDGNYRVPVSIQELQDLDEEQYRELCSKPREDYNHPTPPEEKSTELEVIFESAKIRAGKRHKTTGGLPVEALKKISTEAPNCLRDLAEFKKVAADKSFNALAMQVGVLIARSGLPEDAYRPQLDRLAENSSTPNTSVAGRKEELEAQIRYMKSNQSYEFSCAAMRDLLTHRPCEGCPMEKEGSQGTGGGIGLGVEKRPEGYFFIGQKTDIQLSTFTLTPTNVVIDRPQDGSAPRRAYTLMEIESEGVNLGEISFNEVGWKSASNFKDEISGLRNLAFMGSDDHVQRIKHMTFSEEGESAGEIMQVYTAGIHTENRMGQKVFTYVEPGFSVNSVRVEGTYRLKGRILCPPVFHTTKLCQKGDKDADAVMLAAMKINTPLNISLILGWFAATHLKAQMMDIYGQFPLLSVWGNAGSGKSKTVEIMSCLCGLDPVKDTPINVSTPTTFAILEYSSSTTTIPRVMEEFNKSKMGSKAYSMVSEFMKAAWGAETIPRGNLARRSGQSSGRTGAYVEAIKISSPIVTVSEQAPEMPALIHRSIQVMMRQSELGDENTYYDAREGMEKLREIGKFLMLTALCNTDEKWIKETMSDRKKHVPRSLDERPRFSAQVLMTGLEWLWRSLTSLGLTSSANYIVNELGPTLRKHYYAIGNDGGSKVVNTEIDSVIDDMATMAALTYQGKDFLVHGKHFVVGDDFIFLEASTCHVLYKKFKSDYDRSMPVIATINQFTLLLRAESYYVGEELVPEISGTRMCFKLDKRKMVKKGLQVNLFEGL